MVKGEGNHRDGEEPRGRRSDALLECGAELRPADADAADHLPLSVIAAAGRAARIAARCCFTVGTDPGCVRM